MIFADFFTGAFHSAATYREVRRRGSFFMGYALMIVAFTTLAATVYFTALIHRELFTAHADRPPLFDSLVKQIANQLPVMSYTEGKLATKDPIPTTIYLSGQAFGEQFTHIPLITIDTTGASNHSNMQTPILVTAGEIIVQERDETKIHPLTRFTEGAISNSFVINRAVIEETASMVITGVHKHLFKIYLVLGLLMWLGYLAFAYVMRIFLLLALGLAGMVIGNMVKSPLRYAQAVGLAAVSYTPVAMLELILFIGFKTAPHMLTLFVAGVVALTAAIVCSSDKATPA